MNLPASPPESNKTRAQDYQPKNIGEKTSMVSIDKEPTIRVGLMASDAPVRVDLKGQFISDTGHTIDGGSYRIEPHADGLRLSGDHTVDSTGSLRLSPTDPIDGRFVIDGVTIGVDFHWQRKETQSFQGALKIFIAGGRLQIINEIPLELYLTSVISSEMNASCPPGLLRAHAIVSRSWLLSQITGANPQAASPAYDSGDRLVRWYGRESHKDFDVCADDHCQRYQGIGKASRGAVFEAVQETRGDTLVDASDAGAGSICDARYSKCCGGMTERYSAAWDERDVPYLFPVYDGAGWTLSPLPLTAEDNADKWICSAPPAYCNTRSPELLSRILPGFDQETIDFYRWEVNYTADELSSIIRERLGIDFGRVLELTPVERGHSARIVLLKIVGEKRTLTIGKELEIRRTLSKSHLYSSAFVVRSEPAEGAPERFKLIGAGWGHGVGLCQIGAAVMADAGTDHRAILSHYFTGASIARLY